MRSLNPKTPWLKIWQPEKIVWNANLLSSSTTSEWRAAPRSHEILVTYFISSAATFRNTGKVYSWPVSWQCGNGKKDGSWVVNVSTGRWQVRGVRWKTVSGRKSEKWSKRSVRVLSLVVPSARVSTEISWTTLHDDLDQETIRESDVWEKQPAQKLVQALVSCFHLNNASCVFHEIQQESKQRSFITLKKKKNNNGKSPRSLRSRIFYLLRTLRVE